MKYVQFCWPYMIRTQLHHQKQIHLLLLFLLSEANAPPHFNLSLNVTTLLKKNINIYSFENTRVNKSLEFITYLLY